MFEKISNILTKHKKKHRIKPQVKKWYYFFDEQKSGKFKRRKKITLPSQFQPFFSNPKVNTKIIFTWVIIVSLILVIPILFFGPFLQVKEIHIFREDSIINIDQAYWSADYIRWKNILLIDTNEIALRLQKTQKSISHIKFDIDFPHHINIHLWSYPALFQTSWHLILSNWVVVSKDSKQYIWIPFIQSSKDMEDYAMFWDSLNTQDLKNLNTLIQEWKKNLLGFDFNSLRYYATEKEVLLMHNSESIFIFNLAQGIEKQIKKLAVYEKEKGNIYEKKYIYIDVRIPEKLYLCPFEAEYSCRENIKYIYGDTIFQDLSIEVSELQQ